jgi:hypothetical protein
MRGRCVMAAVKASRALSRFLPPNSIRSTPPSFVHFIYLAEVAVSASSGSDVSSSDQFIHLYSASRSCR